MSDNIGMLQTFYLPDFSGEEWNDLAALHRAFPEKKTDEQIGPGGQYQIPSVENREK